MAFLRKISIFFKKRKYIFIAVVAVVFLVAIFVFNNKKATNNTIVVRHSDFVNTVSVSGKVVATENVSLAFKNEGRVDRIYFSVGQGIVKSGSLIAKINSNGAEKDVHDAVISLETAKLDLERTKLQNSDANLSSDLQKAYDDGFTAVSDTFLDLPSTITGLDDLLSDNLLSDGVARASGNTAVGYRDQAEELYYQIKNVFKQNRINFRKIDRNSPKSEIENIINETYKTVKTLTDAIKSIKNFADYLSEDTNGTSNYASLQTTLSEYANTTNEHLSNLLSLQKSIKDYKDVFIDTDLDVQSSSLSIRQKENALVDARNKLEDYYIRAPFNGVITKIDAKVGEIAFPNVSLISMMSDDIFQIESYVPEVSISQIKLGDESRVTLDAYGETTPFNAKVVSIDPAETIKDGVSTYKIKLQFGDKDDRIKSGMTANVSIMIFNKPNVVVVPGGSIFEKDGSKFVRIKINNKILDREIFTGSISSLGQTEVVSGLEDGDMVILNSEIK